MAFKPLGVVTTLQTAKDYIRNILNIENEQETLIFNKQLINIIHEAILVVRFRLGQALDSFYYTEVTGLSETSNKIDISSFDIADIQKCKLVYNGNLNVPILSITEYNLLMSIYDSTSLANAVFGYIANQSIGQDTKLCIYVYRGSGVGAPSTVKFSYTRNPQKAVSETDYLDIPENFATIVKDIAVVLMAKKMNKVVPTNISEKVKDYIQEKGAK